MAGKTNASKSKKISKSADRVRVETITHDEAKRKNIPTAEYQSIMQKTDQTPLQVAYERRNRDLDPQLVWRGKDMQDWSDLVVSAPPLYIQEKVHPKVLIDDLIKTSEKPLPEDEQINLFSDFNGLPSEGAKTEFYQHDSHWSNRMILGDSLQVMASLAEREGLRGKVQCIYFDPPYGIKFNSNFQWSTTSRDVKDGKADHITREPEQVKAFRDTWRDGIHTYLTYLRDRLTVARDLLSDSGSIFVQIGDENVHRVRSLLDEVFGEANFITQILFKKTGSMSGNFVSGIADTVLWYGRNRESTKFRRLLVERTEDAVDSGFGNIELENGECRGLSKKEMSGEIPMPKGRRFQTSPLMSAGEAKLSQPFNYQGSTFSPTKGNHWKVSISNMPTLANSGRLYAAGKTLTFKKYLDESRHTPLTNIWMDTMESTFAVQRIYVVQTSSKIVERCLLMSSDPGDLVLDPTCGSGTTAFVSEQWGRRWITADTSRVALALARARIMGARYPFYILSDSEDGNAQEAQLRGIAASTFSRTAHNNIKLGFCYQRVPQITTGTVGNNMEINVIYLKWQKEVESLLRELNKGLKVSWNEWELPQEHKVEWSETVKKYYADLRTAISSRQKEIEKSILAKAEVEYLYDKPYVDKKKVRVAGPFTVESVSPHKVLGVDSDDSLIRDKDNLPKEMSGAQDFTTVILENLKNAGVQQAHKEDKISFTSITPWPGQMICAEGTYIEEKSGKEKRAAIFIGPEFGTVSRPDLVEAAKEAGDADFEVLIACAFNYDARASDFQTLGRIPILKARMNADLHMAEDLKNTGKGNLFVIFGEPDIEIKKLKEAQVQVKINGVDVFHPNTGEVKSDGADGIACWFIDTDYNEESFFVRHAYFLGANDPYKALKTSLKAEIDQDAWDSLNSDTSRPFDKPDSGRIAVKVINHLGDEVMKVFKVE
jgi:adenine-specific DNA-methyltransferase